MKRNNFQKTMPKRISNVLRKVAFDPNSGAGAGHQYAKESEAKLSINNLARTTMQTPALDPDIADIAPSGTVLTSYDNEHLVTYLRLLDAHAEGADWREIARVVLHLDPEHECGRARKTFDSHLSRAKWMTEHSYRHLLCGGASA